MDLDAIMNSMKSQMYGDAAASSDEDPLEDVSDNIGEEDSIMEAAKGIWNPHVTANTAILKRAVAHKKTHFEPQPPGIEAARWKAIRALQGRFERLCAKHLGENWNPAFERWLFCRKLAAPGGDPLLPWGEHAEKDPGLTAELIEGGVPKKLAISIVSELGKAARAAAGTVSRTAGGGAKPVKTEKVPGKDRLDVCGNGLKMQINMVHNEKLQALYKRYGSMHKDSIMVEKRDKQEQPYLKALMTVLLRYNALQGASFQATLPSPKI